jgi:RNA polymerase sigma-70 factor (ECF subfamily)
MMESVSIPHAGMTPVAEMGHGTGEQRARFTDRAHDEGDDAALVAAVATGDAVALDLLYRRYRPVAFAAAYGMLRDPNAAEDAVHDAFLNVWRGARSFQPARGPLRGWLLTIVRNTATDHLRARRFAAPSQDAWESSALTAQSDDDISATVAAAADAGRLRAALQTLPPDQRSTLELAFFGGLTHGEIAARTGVPLGTVKGRVRLGLRRLRHELQDIAPPLSA